MPNTKAVMTSYNMQFIWTINCFYFLFLSVCISITEVLPMLGCYIEMADKCVTPRMSENSGLNLYEVNFYFFLSSKDKKLMQNYLLVCTQVLVLPKNFPSEFD